MNTLRNFQLSFLILGVFALAALPLSITSCSTTQKQSLAAFNGKAKDALESPTGQAVIHAAESEALAIGSSLLFDAVNGGDFSFKADAISGAVAGLRSIEMTPAAFSAPQISQTVSSFTASRQLQPVLAQAVTGIVASATARGVPPSAALEATARGLENAVAQNTAAVQSAAQVP